MYRLICLAVFILWNVNANASGDICNNCTQSGFESKARMLGEGIHVLLDLEGEVIKQYYVIELYAGDTPIIYAGEQDVSTQLQSQFKQAMDYKSEIETFARNFTGNDQAGVSSPWDLSGNGANQNAVADVIRLQQSFTDSVFNYISLLTVLTGKIIPINSTLTYQFPSGGEAVYKISGVNADGSLKLVLTSAVDAYGNSVPVVLQAFQGTFTFSDLGGVQQFRQATQNWGGSFTGVGLPALVGGGGIIPLETECSATDNGYVCVAVRP